MKKLSLQWRLTLITTLFIAIICGCLTMFVYGSGVYYMDSLQETVDAQNTDGLFLLMQMFVSDATAQPRQSHRFCMEG